MVNTTLITGTRSELRLLNLRCLSSPAALSSLAAWF